MFIIKAIRQQRRVVDGGAVIDAPILTVGRLKVISRAVFYRKNMENLRNLSLQGIKR